MIRCWWRVCGRASTADLVCPLSNLEIARVFDLMADHNILEPLDKGVCYCQFR